MRRSRSPASSYCTASARDSSHWDVWAFRVKPRLKSGMPCLGLEFSMAQTGAFFLVTAICTKAGRITRDTSAFQPQSPDPWQLERRHGGIEADIEPQDVQLEPFVDGEEEAGKTVERNLEPGAA